MSVICAPATRTGGAIAVVRVSGEGCLALIDNIFTAKNHQPLTAAKPYTLHYGEIKDSQGNTLDDVLISVFHAPNSYTGEESAEISCHGSQYITNAILQLLIDNGCRMAQPGEYTRRAYLNGKMDLSQAEAVADLIAANNKATHHLAMSQLKGHFSSELSKLREQLLKMTSLLELELDFSDHEELEFADRTELIQLARHIDDRVSTLAHSFMTGNALKKGIPVAIVGKTNVGKSTLLNQLFHEDKAIVSDIDGTTRDTVEDTMLIHGITFRFIDTAGIRHTDDQIESLGIERSIAAAQRARIIIMMTEPSVPYPDVPTNENQTVIRIENKTDLNTACGDSATATSLSISAKCGIGLDDLRQHLIDAAPKTSDSDVIITNARHYDALLRANESIQRVIDGLQTQLSGDLLSEDLRQAIDILAEITGGQITPQETLNNIFSHFCVGK